MATEKLFLPLNLQFFAEGDDDPKDEPTDAPEGDEPQDDDKSTDNDAGDERKFTQAEFERALKERLRRETEKRKKAEEEAALKEQGKYKDLLEAKEIELAALQAQVKSSEIDGLKTRLLVGAGYTEDQFDFVKKNLEGETEEDLKASLESVRKFIAPKAQGNSNSDPQSQGNGQRSTPPKNDGVSAGRELAKKLLAKQQPKKDQ